MITTKLYHTNLIFFLEYYNIPYTKVPKNGMTVSSTCASVYTALDKRIEEFSFGYHCIDTDVATFGRHVCYNFAKDKGKFRLADYFYRGISSNLKGN